MIRRGETVIRLKADNRLAKSTRWAVDSSTHLWDSYSSTPSYKASVTWDLADGPDPIALGA